MLLALAVGPAAAAPTPLLPGSFSGDAYGTYANAAAGPIAAQLGRSANLPCPCNGTNGQTLTNEIDNLKAGVGGAVLSASAVISTVATNKTASTAEVTETSRIVGLNLLGGLVTADSVQSVADVSADTSTISDSSSGTSLVNLVVGGQSISANVAPNTKITLAGIGTVTLNKQTKGGNFISAGRLTVSGIVIDVSLGNSLGLPVGTEIVVAYAGAGYSRTQPGAVFAGNAYAIEANAAIGQTLQNQIGRAAYISMGCLGTNGVTNGNNVGAVAVGSVVAIGAGTSTVESQTVNGVASATSADQVTGVSLLGGLITASAVTSVAEESLNSGALSYSSNGTTFATLKVAGIPVPVTVAPNTVIALPLLGHVTVNEQLTPVPGHGNQLQVNGLHIVISTQNLLGLPVGSELIVAHAAVTLKNF